jgi:hypothetical protein
MAHPAFARVLLTGIAVAQGLATLKIDLHRSHATNPLWPSHARFHLVWQVLNLVLLAFAEVALVWWFGPLEQARFYLAACLIGITFVGFWGALATMRLYAGALFDPNGILPLKVKIGEKILQVEMNMVAVLCGSIALLIAVCIYR